MSLTSRRPWRTHVALSCWLRGGGRGARFHDGLAALALARTWGKMLRKTTRDCLKLPLHVAGLAAPAQFDAERLTGTIRSVWPPARCNFQPRPDLCLIILHPHATITGSGTCPREHSGRLLLGSRGAAGGAAATARVGLGFTVAPTKTGARRVCMPALPGEWCYPYGVGIATIPGSSACCAVTRAAISRASGAGWCLRVAARATGATSALPPQGGRGHERPSAKQ